MTQDEMLNTVEQTEALQQALFRLLNRPPYKPAPWKSEPPEPCRQKVLLTGMDCLAGQKDLFDT